MRPFTQFLLRRWHPMEALPVVIVCMLIGGTFTQILASGTSNFQQEITAGTLSIDIVDSGYSTVANPSISMSSKSFGFGCQTSTGTFGTSSERIYVQNPDAADNGWTASLAASATTSKWDSAGTDYDFNDDGGSGCTDSGVDADSLGGQMTVDPSAGTLNTGQCSSCSTNNVSKGSSNAYIEGSVNSITVLTATSDSDDIGDWRLTGVSISQKIPAEQPAAADYDINMVLSLIAS